MLASHPAAPKEEIASLLSEGLTKVRVHEEKILYYKKYKEKLSKLLENNPANQNTLLELFIEGNVGFDSTDENGHLPHKTLKMFVFLKLITADNNLCALSNIPKNTIEHLVSFLINAYKAYLKLPEAQIKIKNGYSRGKNNSRKNELIITNSLNNILNRLVMNRHDIFAQLIRLQITSDVNTQPVLISYLRSAIHHGLFPESHLWPHIYSELFSFSTNNVVVLSAYYLDILSDFAEKNNEFCATLVDNGAITFLLNNLSNICHNTHFPLKLLKVLVQDNPAHSAQLMAYPDVVKIIFDTVMQVPIYHDTGYAILVNLASINREYHARITSYIKIELAEHTSSLINTLRVKLEVSKSCEDRAKNNVISELFDTALPLFTQPTQTLKRNRTELDAMAHKINRPLNDSDLKKISSTDNFKFELNAGLETLKKVAAIGCTLTYSEIQCFVHPKYLEDVPFHPNKKYKNSIPIENNNESDIATLECAGKVILQQQRINDLSNSNHGSASSSIHTFNLAGYQFMASSTLQATNPNAKVIFVFAGQKEQALLPVASRHVRVIVVVTPEEYHDIQSPQLAGYDFLLVSEFEQIGDEPRTAGALTSRRRAVLDFSMTLGLNRIIMMDDNIKTIHLKVDSSIARSSDDLLNFYTYMSEKVDESQEPFVSVDTYSNLNKTMPENSFGCELFMLDLQAIRTAFSYHNVTNVEQCGFVLMPEKDTATQEDYFLQSVLHVLFQDEHNAIKRQGFCRLPHDEVQLIRSQRHKNSAQKSTPRASIITLTEAYKKYVSEKLSDDVLEKIQLATLVFNSLMQDAIRKHTEKCERLKASNPAQNDAKSSSISYDHCGNGQSVKDCLDPLANLASSNILLYKHQQEALNFYLANLKMPKISFKMVTGSGKTRVLGLIALAKFQSASTENVVIICPTQDLVEQNKSAIRALIALFDFDIGEGRVISISSSEDATTEQRALQHAEGLKINRHIIIICYASYAKLIKDMPTFPESASLIIHDESHLVDKEELILEDIPATQVLNFSATPKPNKDNIPEFIYTKKRAIEEEILAPLIIDYTFLKGADSIDLEQFYQILQVHKHPDSFSFDKNELITLNQLTLKDHKGIIFVDDINIANALSKLLLKIGGLPVYTINSENCIRKDEIEKFNKETCGIVVAVNMLTTGYDDLILDWIWIAKMRKIPPATLEQMLGRVGRKDPNYPHKIGYAILPRIYSEGSDVEALFPEKFEKKAAIVSGCTEYTFSNTYINIFEHKLFNLDSNTPAQLESYAQRVRAVKEPNALRYSARNYPCFFASEPDGRLTESADIEEKLEITNSFY